MRAVIQRVNQCKVEVDNKIVGSTGKGVCVLLGVGNGDTTEDADYLVDKIINLRIFDDEEGKMNLSTAELELEVMVISQFTLYGDCRSGRRPGYSNAASPDKAKELYNYFLQKIEKTGLSYSYGEFKAYMDVFLINDGPVTLLLDSSKNF